RRDWRRTASRARRHGSLRMPSSIAPRDVGGQLVEALSRVAGERRRLDGNARLDHQSTDLVLDLVERARLYEDIAQRLHVIDREAGGAEARKYRAIAGRRDGVSRRDERRRLAFAQVVADRLADDVGIAERTEDVVAQLEGPAERQADRRQRRRERGPATGER